LFPIALQDEITVISPSNFIIEESFEMNEHSFVMYPAFSDVIRELERVIINKDVQQLGIVRFQSDFGAEIEETLREIMFDLDRQDVFVVEYAEIGGSDLRTEVIKLKANNIEAVFLDTLDFDTIKFLKRANEFDYHPLIITHTTVRDVVANPEIETDVIEGIVMLDWEVSY